MILEIKENKNTNSSIIERAKSEIIKNNFSRKDEPLSDKLDKIQKTQIILYNNIKNKIVKYINKTNYNQRKRINKNTILCKQKKIKPVINSNESSQNNFSFKNEKVPKKNLNNLSKGPNTQNINKKYVMKPNIHPNKNGNLKNLSKINKTNNITLIRPNKYISNNNISTKEKEFKNGFNIYINTTVHTDYPPKENNYNNVITYQNQSPNSLIPLTQNLVVNKTTNNINTPNIKQINMKISPNKNIILIPKTQNPKFPKISDKLYFTNNKNNFRGIYNNIFNSSNIKSSNSSLKMNSKNKSNLPSSNSTIKTFDYKPIYMRQRNSPVNNNNLNVKRILLFDNNIKSINANNLQFKNMTKKHSYDSIFNNVKYQNIMNRNNSREKINQMVKNIQNNNIKNYNINKQKDSFQLNNMNKLKIRHYSPDNNMEKNKYKYLLKNDGLFINIIRQQRSNSNSGEKKCLNYNDLNLSGKDSIRNLLHQPRNLNIWNSKNMYNYEKRCFNLIKA